MADQSQTENSIPEQEAQNTASAEQAATKSSTAKSTASKKTASRAPRRRTKPTTHDVQQGEGAAEQAQLPVAPAASDEATSASLTTNESATSAEASSSPAADDDSLPRPPSGRRSKTRPAGPPSSASSAVTAPSDEAPAVATETSETASGSEPTQDIDAGEKPKSTRSRSSRSKSTANRRAEQADGEPAAATAQSAGSDAVVGADPDAVAAAVDAMPKRTRSRSGQRQAAEQLLGDVPTDENGEVDKAAALQSLAAAIAGVADGEADSNAADSAPDSDAEQTDSDDAQVEQSDNESDAESDENSEGQSSSSRRRRRRGGRRRRRGGSGANADTDNEESDDADSESQDGPDGNSEPDAETQSPSESSTTETDNTAEGAEANGDGVRRRRRRRRGGSDGTEDPDVVIEVREPRQRATTDEVTGIEGSTRLEAKRQRRKEGRAAGRNRAPILTEAEFLARRESVNRKMIVRQSADYTQIAVLEDDILVEHYVDRDSSASAIGNVYLGKVQNVLPSMEAVFVDIGRGRNAVLYAGEVNWDAFEVADDQRKVEEVFKSGQSVIVQVSKDSVGAKGARLTGHISIPGRFVVYSPDGHLSGISRKLPDVERTRLKNVLDDVVGEQGSVIVRTAAEGANEEELVKDVERLKAHWEVIERKAKQGGAPVQLYTEPDLTLRTIRDVFTEDFNELIVAGIPGANDVFDNIDQYVQTVAPSLHDRLSRWDSESQGDPFEKYRIEEQISKALERKVFLPSGGSLVIDRTEAMTVIDVNTGKFTGTGGNLEETVTRNNLEAAEEIVRQLRLRDLGGIVVIDFIDMVLPANRELLLRRLVECLGRDRTRHQVSEVTSLGLVQLTRKRIGTGLAEAFTEECESCGGRGFIRHEHPVSTQAPADGGDRHESHSTTSNKRTTSRGSASSKGSAGKSGQRRTSQSGATKSRGSQKSVKSESDGSSTSESAATAAAN